MTVVANNLISDSLVVLPAREEPYLLQDVYEQVQYDCLSEIVLDLADSYIRFRADENLDTLCYDYHHGEFEPTSDYVSCSSFPKLTGNETDILKALAQGKKTKQRLLAMRLRATAEILGAGSKKDLGKQGGGLLGQGLIALTGKRPRGSIQYEITSEGRIALASAPWKKFLGKELGWTWVAVNQQGYCDSVMLSFDGIVPTILLNVVASSIKVCTIAIG